MQGTLHTQLEEKETKEAVGALAISRTKLRHDAVLPRNHLTGRRISSQHAKGLKQPRTVLPSMAPETDMPEFELAAPRRRRVFGHNTFMGQPAPDNIYNVLPSEALHELYNTGLGFKRKKFAKVLFCRTDKAAEQFQFEILDKIISAMVQHIYRHAYFPDVTENQVNFDNSFSAELWQIAINRLHKTTYSPRVYARLLFAQTLAAAIYRDRASLTTQLKMLDVVRPNMLTVTARVTMDYVNQKLYPISYGPKTKVGSKAANLGYHSSVVSTPVFVNRKGRRKRFFDAPLEIIEQCDHKADSAVREALYHQPQFFCASNLPRKMTPAMTKAFQTYQQELESNPPPPLSLGWVLKMHHLIINYQVINDKDRRHIERSMPLIITCPLLIEAILTIDNSDLLNAAFLAAASNTDTPSVNHQHDWINEYNEFSANYDIRFALLSTSSKVAQTYLARIAERYLTLIAAEVVPDDEISETRYEKKLQNHFNHIRDHLYRKHLSFDLMYPIVKPLSEIAKLNVLSGSTDRAQYFVSVVGTIPDSDSHRLCRALILECQASEDESVLATARSNLDFLLGLSHSDPGMYLAPVLFEWDDLLTLEERQALLTDMHLQNLVAFRPWFLSWIPSELRGPFCHYIRTHAQAFFNQSLLHQPALLYKSYLEAHPDLAIQELGLVAVQEEEPTRPHLDREKIVADLYDSVTSVMMNSTDNPDVLVAFFSNRLHDALATSDFGLLNLDTLSQLVKKTKNAENRITWSQLFDLLESCEWCEDDYLSQLHCVWLDIVTDFCEDSSVEYHSIWEVPGETRNHPRITQFLKTMAQRPGSHIASLFQLLTDEQRSELAEINTSRQSYDQLYRCQEQLTGPVQGCAPRPTPPPPPQKPDSYAEFSSRPYPCP